MDHFCSYFETTWRVLSLNGKPDNRRAAGVVTGALRRINLPGDYTCPGLDA
jgi:hypothetical protein